MQDSSTAFVASLIEDKSDPILGAKVKQYLRQLGLENTYQPNEEDSRALVPGYRPKAAFTALEQGIHGAYVHLGLDVQRDPSIQDTPKRFAKMFVGELTRGLNYDFFPKCTATPNGNMIPNPDYAKELEAAATARIGETVKKPEEFIVKGGYDQMVLVKDITTVSLCEHHLQTIDGVTHIAYIPKHKVLGLSKFARVAEFFAARPQIQERMTEQIYAALQFILGTDDIAVVQDSVHFCMRARGVRQPNSRTFTDKVGGRFLTNATLRKEFFDAIK